MMNEIYRSKYQACPFLSDQSDNLRCDFETLMDGVEYEAQKKNYILLVDSAIEKLATQMEAHLDMATITKIINEGD